MATDYVAISLAVPLLGAVLMFLLGRNDRLVKMVALGVSLVPLALTSWMWLNLDTRIPYDYFVTYPWIPSLGISVIFGLDGLSMPLFWLTALLTTLGMWFSWDVSERVPEFFALLLLLETAVMGVFASLDYFLFYVFWEVVLIPMYFLIAIWGGPRRKYAAIKFFVYTFTASLVMLLGFMALYFQTGIGSFSMIEIAKTAPLLPQGMQILIFGSLFIGFGVKLPMVPFHTWLPDAHVEAPTAGSVMLAGVLLKMGAYGFLRIALPALPFGAQWFVPFFLVVGIVSILYGAFICLAQTDLKRLVALSSVSHMGFVFLGIAASLVTGTSVGINGAIFMLFAHGLISPALFMMCGLVGHATGTREIPRLGGLSQKMPNAAFAMMAASLASLGLPGMAGFIAELQVFIATWDAFGWLILLPIASVAVTAGYYLWAMERSFFGPLTTKVETHHLSDWHAYEAIPLLVLILLMVAFGLHPAALNDYSNPVTAAILAATGGGA